MYSWLNPILKNRSLKPDCLGAVTPLIWVIVSMGNGVMGTQTDGGHQTTESWKRRMAWLEVFLKMIQFQATAVDRDTLHYARLPSTPYNVALNISRDGTCFCQVSINMYPVTVLTPIKHKIAILLNKNVIILLTILISAGVQALIIFFSLRNVI